MTKKGETGTYHKPKPRIAVYGGLILSGLYAIGGRPFTRPTRQEAIHNVMVAGTDSGTVIATATPAVVGVVASVAADKTGVNKLLAKMRLPFRI